MRIVADPASKAREVISASRALAALDKVNIESVPQVADHRHTVSIESRKAALAERIAAMRDASLN